MSIQGGEEIYGRSRISSFEWYINHITKWFHFLSDSLSKHQCIKIRRRANNVVELYKGMFLTSQIIYKHIPFQSDIHESQKQITSFHSCFQSSRIILLTARLCGDCLTQSPSWKHQSPWCVYHRRCFKQPPNSAPNSLTARSGVYISYKLHELAHCVIGSQHM